MLIPSDKVQQIKNNKVCFVKDFISLKNNYDFNFISKILEENNLNIINHTCYHNLKDVYQIVKISSVLKEFNILFDFFKKLFKYESHEKDEVDLFFSLVSQVGPAHADFEDVYIIGLEGKTMYKIYNDDNDSYEINKGDLIFIPKGIKHKVIGITPRIIASIGYYGGKING